MDVQVLEKIWGKDEHYVFTPVIQGWETTKTGRKKAVNYSENTGRKPSESLPLIARTDPLRSRIDCYFCPVKFKTPDRKKENAVEQLNLLWADLDDAHPEKLPVRPTVAWHSSDHHYQAIWVLDRHLPIAEIEKLNKAMSYACGADKSGWDLTQLLRIPGSYNFKYDDVQECKLMWDDGETYGVEYVRSELAKHEKPSVEVPGKIGSLESLVAGWKLSKRAQELLNTKAVPEGEDRSERLWELEKLLIESGLPVASIIEIIKLSVWNKFADRKDGDKQLLAETLKAETEYRTRKVEDSALVKSGLEIVTFDAFMEQYIPEPSWLVEGFVQKASVGMTAGEPKTMKSTMMLDMAVSVASGKPFLGVYKTESCPVLYVQEENSKADIKRRFMRIAYHRRVMVDTPLGAEPLPIPLHIVNNPGINLLNEADQGVLEETVRSLGIKFLILDPWYMMCGNVDENNAKDVTPVLKYLTYLRNAYDCSVILVHHFKKGDASRGGQRMRGSSVFHSWVECGLYAELNKGKAGSIILEREFRAFPSMQGLNIVFGGREEVPTEYDVRVSLAGDSYTKSLSRGEVKEVPDSEVEAVIPTLTLDPDDEAELMTGDLDEDKLLEIIKRRMFELDHVLRTFGGTKKRIHQYLEQLAKDGKISLRVPLMSVKTTADIKITGGM